MKSRSWVVLAPHESRGDCATAEPPAARRGLRRCRTLFVFVALTICGWSETLPAQSIPFSFEPASTAPPIVDDRPTITEWVASVRGGGLVEGRLELRLTAISSNMPAQFLGTVRTDELVFSGADQRVRILLPPFNWSQSADEILVQLLLHTKQGAVRLPEQRLRAPLATVRKFPLLLGETRTKPRTKPGDILVRDRFSDRLRFESLLPEELKDRALTVIDQIDVTEFPQDPLAYCQFELVSVTGDVFAGLRGPQMEALLKWVRAGGSLCLEPSGFLSTAHVEFLNRLAEEDDRTLVFALDEKGRLAGSISESDDYLNLACGLGRVVLSLTAEETLTQEVALPALAWLWKIRDDTVPSLLAGQTPLMLHESDIQKSPQGYYLGLPAPLFQDVTGQMVDWLRPEGVRLVPLWIIASLLSLLVFWIGPGDYFVLSLLRRRKWTWITFPVAVLAATLLMISITNAYLSSAETRRALVLYDVGHDGEIVRTNRFELVFTSATRQTKSARQSSLFSPLLTGGNTDPRMRAAGYRQQIVNVKGPDGKTYQRVVMVPNTGGSLAEPISVEGRVPSRYQVMQEVRQWTPQLNRSFSIGPVPESPAIDWSAISLPDPVETTSQPINYDEMLVQIRAQFGPAAEAAVLDLAGHVWSSELREPRHQDFTAANQMQFPVSPRMNSLLRLTSAPTFGLFALVYQASPHGGSSLDDLLLTVSDATNRRWLLVLVPQGDDIVVYRKSYPSAR